MFTSAGFVWTNHSRVSRHGVSDEFFAAEGVDDRVGVEQKAPDGEATAVGVRTCGLSCESFWPGVFVRQVLGCHHDSRDGSDPWVAVGAKPCRARTRSRCGLALSISLRGWRLVDGAGCTRARSDVDAWAVEKDPLRAEGGHGCEVGLSARCTCFVHRGSIGSFEGDAQAALAASSVAGSAATAGTASASAGSPVRPGRRALGWSSSCAP
jgi:hypothetical protein